MKKPHFSEYDQRNKLFAFKTSEKMANLLYQEDNKSKIVNEALMMYYRKFKPCPRCNGSGKVKYK